MRVAFFNQAIHLGATDPCSCQSLCLFNIYREPIREVEDFLFVVVE
jgi:hypothetical protein